MGGGPSSSSAWASRGAVFVDVGTRRCSSPSHAACVVDGASSPSAGTGVLVDVPRRRRRHRRTRRGSSRRRHRRAGRGARRRRRYGCAGRTWPSPCGRRPACWSASRVAVAWYRRAGRSESRGRRGTGVLVDVAVDVGRRRRRRWDASRETRVMRQRYTAARREGPLPVDGDSGRQQGRACARVRQVPVQRDRRPDVAIPRLDAVVGRGDGHERERSPAGQRC